ncbi:DUF2732 domain-containing protein [Rahnella aceris]|uniref:DUF2732 domain-containing protein n=1 Tax=Rahnella sp. (strain Y9602) TaxID=2703885 RepID=UPI001C264E0A|nr:DUF2732 domain-containing protein [Rahnella aceris]MBU9853028.1 DUF2732 domain-containing protein [Rahnella aceris]
MSLTVGQEMRNKADSEATNWMLNQARNQAKADAAITFSSHLDSLISHAIQEQLDRVQILELLGQESIRFHNEGLENKGVV